MTKLDYAVMAAIVVTLFCVAVRLLVILGGH